jgi:hypothetical protein
VRPFATAHRRRPPAGMPRHQGRYLAHYDRADVRGCAKFPAYRRGPRGNARRSHGPGGEPSWPHRKRPRPVHQPRSRRRARARVLNLNRLKGCRRPCGRARRWPRSSARSRCRARRSPKTVGLHQSPRPAGRPEQTPDQRGCDAGAHFWRETVHLDVRARQAGEPTRAGSPPAGMRDGASAHGAVAPHHSPLRRLFPTRPQRRSVAPPGSSQGDEPHGVG